MQFENCSQYSMGTPACIAWHSMCPHGSAASGTRHNQALCSLSSTCLMATTKAGHGQRPSGSLLLGPHSRLVCHVKCEENRQANMQQLQKDHCAVGHHWPEASTGQNRQRGTFGCLAENVTGWFLCQRLACIRVVFHLVEGC